MYVTHFIHNWSTFSWLSTETDAKQSSVVEMCPRFPEPVPLKHPIKPLKAALEKVDLLQHIFLI